MRKLIGVLCFLFVAVGFFGAMSAQGQTFKIDTTLYPQNEWRPTEQTMKAAYHIVWNEQLRADTIKLRPGQSVWALIDGAGLTITLDSVGVGSFRHSYYTAEWHLDTLDKEVVFDLPNWNYGEPDCEGIVKNPSVTIETSGLTKGFIYGDKQLDIIPIKIEGLGGTVRTHNRFILSDNPVKKDSLFWVR